MKKLGLVIATVAMVTMIFTGCQGEKLNGDKAVIVQETMASLSSAALEQASIKDSRDPIAESKGSVELKNSDESLKLKLAYKLAVGLSSDFEADALMSFNDFSMGELPVNITLSDGTEIKSVKVKVDGKYGLKIWTKSSVEEGVSLSAGFEMGEKGIGLRLTVEGEGFETISTWINCKVKASGELSTSGAKLNFEGSINGSSINSESSASWDMNKWISSVKKIGN